MSQSQVQPVKAKVEAIDSIAAPKSRKELRSSAVLATQNFQQNFKLSVDAGGVGAGAVVMQEDDMGIDHSVCYYSKKFNKRQKNYSTIEKETRALPLALQQFEVFLGAITFTIVVFRDHNSLTSLHKMRNKNH